MPRTPSPLLLLTAVTAFGWSASAAAADITLTAADQTKLHAVATGEGTKGAVLVHMLGRSSNDWSFFADRLSKSEVRTVAVDLRGHGKSDRADDILEDADYPAMKADVIAAVDWLRDQGVTEVSCVGASIGANLCLQVAAGDPGIVNVVALSPGLKYKGVTSVDALTTYGARPVLIVASEDDSYAAKTGMVLDERATGQHHFELLKAAGHGTKMLNREPRLEGLVLSWLVGTFELAPGELVMPRPATDAQVDKVETTGDKLDTHK
jgi:pimeloyl-ACP methyl ester carboxylesterase